MHHSAATMKMEYCTSQFVLWTGPLSLVSEGIWSLLTQTTAALANQELICIVVIFS